MHAQAQYLNSFVDLLCVGEVAPPSTGIMVQQRRPKEIASVAKVIFLERFCVV